MAIYSFRFSKISRSKGQTSLSNLAYISGEKIKDETLNTTHSYGNRDRILTTGTLFPSQQAEEKYQTAEKLFNEAERFEKQRKAVTARKIIAALPRELTLEQQKEIVEKFIRENLNKEGYAATYAIHNDADNNNPHVHILVTNRPMKKNGDFVQAKSKKIYDLDENGNKIPVTDEATGQQKVDKSRHKLWKHHTETLNPITKKDFLLQMRKSWADICNEQLPEELHISEKSYKELGIEQEPTLHEGHDGYKASIAQHNEEVNERNQARWIMQLIEAKNSIKKLIDRLKVMTHGVSGHDRTTGQPERTTSAREPATQAASFDAATTAAINQLNGETKRRADEQQRREAERLAEERREAELKRQKAERERREAEQQREATHSRGLHY